MVRKTPNNGIKEKRPSFFKVILLGNTTKHLVINFNQLRTVSLISCIVLNAAVTLKLFSILESFSGCLMF